MRVLDNAPNTLQPPRYPGSQQVRRGSGGGSQTLWVKTTDRAPADIETVRAYLVAHDPTLTLNPRWQGYFGEYCDNRWVIHAAA